MAFNVGGIYLDVGAVFSDSGFDKWDRAVDEARAKAKDPIDAKVGADTSHLASDLAGARGMMQAWANQEYDAEIGINEPGFVRSLSRLAAMMDVFRAAASRPITIPVRLDLSEAESQLALFRSELAALGREIPIGAGGVALPGGAAARPVLPASVTGGQEFWGVRGRDRVGSTQNPLAMVLIAGRMEPLGGYAAAAGYQPELTVGAGGGDRGGMGVAVSSSQPARAAGGGAPAWFNVPQVGQTQENVTITPDQDALTRALSATQAQLDTWAAAADETVTIDVNADPSDALRDISTVRAAWAALSGDISKTNLTLGAAGGRAQRLLGSRGTPYVDPMTNRYTGSLTGEQLPPYRVPYGNRDYVGPFSPPTPSPYRPDWVFASGGGGGAPPPPPPPAPPGGAPPPGGGWGDSNTRHVHMWYHSSSENAPPPEAPGLFGGPIGSWISSHATGRGLAGWPLLLHGPLGGVGSALGLGPEHFLGAAASIIGSGVGALGGAGVLGLGTAGTAAVGMGTDAAGLKQAANDIKAVTQAQNQLTQAVAVYGKNSQQAKDAQAQLNYTLNSFSPVAKNAVLAAANTGQQFKKMFDQATGQAEKTGAQIIQRAMKVGETFLPIIGKYAAQNMKIIQRGVQPFFMWLKGPEGIGIFTHLEDVFQSQLPTAIDAATKTIEALMRTVSVASDFTGRFVKGWDNLANRWNTMPVGELHDKMAKLVNDFNIWWNMIKLLGKDLYELFHSGVGEGNNLVIMFTHLLQKWNDWMTSIKGQAWLHQFFANREAELVAILHVVGALFSMFGQLYSAIQPLVPAVTAFAQAIATGLGDFGKTIITPLAHALKNVLEGVMSILKVMGPFKDVVLVPLGLFLAAWRFKNLETAVGLLGRFRELAVASVRALLGLESASGVWAKIKNVFTGSGPTDGPGKMLAALKEGAAANETAIKTGADYQATKIKEAMSTGGGEAAAEQKTAISEGGTIAGAKEEAGTAKGGAIAGEEEAAGSASGAGGAGLFSRLFGRGGKTAAAAEGALATDAAGAVGGATLAERLAKGNFLSRGLGKVVGKLGIGGEGSLLSKAPSLFEGLGSKLLTGGLIFSGGQLASQLLGGLIGGGPGKTVAGLGSWASGGAAVGSLFSPVGTVVGGLGGAAIKGIMDLANNPKQLRDIRFTPAMAGGQTVIPVAGARHFTGSAAGMASLGSGTAGPGYDPQKFVSVSGVQALKDMQNAVKKDVSTGNLAALAALGHEALNTGDSLKKMGVQGAQSFITLGKRILELKTGSGKNLKEWSAEWDKSILAINHQMSNYYKSTHQGLKSLQDDYSTVMRHIQSTIGLSSREGRDEATKNTTMMINNMSKEIANGSVKAKAGMDAINNVLHKALQFGYSNWMKVWQNTFDNTEKLYKDHKIHTGQYLDEMQTLMQQKNQQMTQHTQDQYRSMFQNLQKQYDQGIIKWSEYHQRRNQLQQQEDTTLLQIQSGNLSKFVSNEETAMKNSGNWTHAGMAAVVSQVNKALHGFGISPLPAPDALQWASFMAGTAGQASYATSGQSGKGHRFERGGGLVPGRQWGYQDNMTLIDPMGTPVAKMAGDEGIVTRHQTPYVETGMAVAKAMGIIPYGSLEELWSGVTRPHGYAGGGKLPGYAWGGYIDPISGFSLGRTDMGVDASAAPGTPIRAFGPSKMVGYQSNWYQHQPEMVFQLLGGPDRGKYWYVAEQITPTAHMGETIPEGGIVARFAPSGTGIEIGWAADASGTTLAQGTSGYSEGQVTAAGQSFMNLLKGLPSVPGGAASVPQIKAPHVQGRGKLTQLVQGGVDKTTKAANQYLQKKLGPLVGGGSVGSLGGGPIVGQIARGLEHLGYNKIAAAGIIGNIAQESNFQPGISGGLFQFTPPIPGSSGSVAQQLGLMWSHGGSGILRTMNASQTPAQAATTFMNSFERPNAALANLPNRIAQANAAYAQGYSRGGRLPGFASGGFLPGFQGGGSPRLYTATPPGPKSSIPTIKPVKVAPPWPEDILMKVPGLGDKTGPFTKDDWRISRLEYNFGNEQTLSGTIYPSGMPDNVLNLLFGYKQGEWDILMKEWTKLPGFLNNLQNILQGKWKPIENPYGGAFGGPPVGYKRSGGINDEVRDLIHAVNHDERTMYSQNKMLYRDEKHIEREMQSRGKKGKKGYHAAQISKQAENAAGQLASNMVKLYDEKHDALHEAHKITDKIEALNDKLDRAARRAARSQHGAHGATLFEPDHKTIEQIQDLKARREHQIDISERCTKQLDPMWDKNAKNLNDKKLTGYALAWRHEIMRLQVGEKIRTIQASIADLKKKLTKEERRQTDFQKAIADITSRLYGGPASSGGTSVHDSLQSVGLDILSLFQQGADIPKPFMDSVVKFLKSSGMHIPPGALNPNYPDAAAALQDFLNFQADRANLFSSFGSNFVAAGASPFGTPAALAAGMQYYGAASGASTGVPQPEPAAAAQGGYLPGAQRGGDTVFNIEQHFSGLPDPHTQSAGLLHELNALGV